MGAVPRERGGCSFAGLGRQTWPYPLCARQRRLQPSQSVRPNRSPRASFSTEHFLPKRRLANKSDILFRQLPGDLFGFKTVAMLCFHLPPKIALSYLFTFNTENGYSMLNSISYASWVLFWQDWDHNAAAPYFAFSGKNELGLHHLEERTLRHSLPGGRDHPHRVHEQEVFIQMFCFLFLLLSEQGGAWWAHWQGKGEVFITVCVKLLLQLIVSLISLFC